MPNTSLTQAIKEAYTLAPAGEVILETLQLSHPSMPTPIFLVRDRQDQVLMLEDGTTAVFTACAFRMALPEVRDNGIQELDIAIDNVDQSIGDFIDAVEDSNIAVSVVYRPYLYSNPNTPQMNPPLRLTLTDITQTNVEITGKATFGDVLNRTFPTQLYTRERFPSLANG